MTIVQTESEDAVDAPGEPRLDEKTEHSPYLVKWDGPNDPDNPKVRPFLLPHSECRS